MQVMRTASVHPSCNTAAHLNNICQPSWLKLHLAIRRLPSRISRHNLRLGGLSHSA